MAERKTFKKGKKKKTMKKRTIRYSKIKTNSKRKIRSRKKNRKKKVKGWNYKLLKHNANLKQYQLGGQDASMEAQDTSLEASETPTAKAEREAVAAKIKAAKIKEAKIKEAKIKEAERWTLNEGVNGNRQEEYESLVQTYEKAYTAYHSWGSYFWSPQQTPLTYADADGAIEDAAKNWTTVTGQSGEEINGFVVKSQISRGGDGKVFLVEKNRGKYVLKAIERLTPERDVYQREGATNEVEIMIRLINAPFVARIYHHFQSPKNYCIVSKFYQGGDLGINLMLRHQKLKECLTGDTDAKKAMLSSMVGTVVRTNDRVTSLAMEQQIKNLSERFIYEGNDDGTKHLIGIEHRPDAGYMPAWTTKHWESDALEWAQKYSETTTANLLAQIVLALEYMHNRDICHLDIKARNIVISAEGHAYLTDFHASRKQEDGLIPNDGPMLGMVNSIREVGSWHYPPELYREVDEYKEGYRVDGRKVDCWALALVIKEMCGYKSIIREKLSTLDGLIEGMERPLEKRFTIKEIKRHAFFKGINWDELSQQGPQPPCASGSRAGMCVRRPQVDERAEAARHKFDSGVDNGDPLALFKESNPILRAADLPVAFIEKPLPIEGGFKK